MELLEQLRSALGERYRVEREVTQSGVVTVFLAHDLKLRRPVAIKLLKPELSATLPMSDSFAKSKVPPRCNTPTFFRCTTQDRRATSPGM